MKKNVKKQYFSKPIHPQGVKRGINLTQLIDSCLTSFNGRALRHACQLYAQQILDGRTTVGMSLAGALIPAGYGRSCLVPLIRHGYVDWMISTGANLYHDLHACLGYGMYEGSPHVDDCRLR